ncbi:MAG TPA: family 43 glycosylhydrolase, partial [Brevundimonas sp.]
MKLRTIGLAGALVLALLGPGCAPSQPPAPRPAQTLDMGRPRNPVFAAADPHLAVAEGRWWVYATTPQEAGRPDWDRFYAWSSPDLRRWSRSGPIFSFDGVDWIDDDGRPDHGLWAPAVAQANGRYYLYYSVGPQNPTPSRLGVAVGYGPTGPFTDSGRPLYTGGDGFEAIDPMVFVDPRTGTAYLYAGGSAGSTLKVFELEPSMTAIRREVAIAQPPN